MGFVGYGWSMGFWNRLMIEIVGACSFKDVLSLAFNSGNEILDDNDQSFRYESLHSSATNSGDKEDLLLSSISVAGLCLIELLRGNCCQEHH